MSKKKDSLKPWLSRPAINRSVTLPLTRPLTQRLSNLNEFHPNELDPYLLFDARDSMIGTLENPTLDLDPSKPDTLNVITATRSGVATYTDPDGNIATASADTVRVDYVDGVPMILVEPSSENLVSYSEDFSNSYWGKSDVTVASAPVAAPDGTMTASHVVKTGSDGHLYKTNIGAANTHRFSIWARTVSGSGTCIFNSNAGVLSTITDQWQRFEVTSTNAHAYAVNFRGASTLTEIYIWGAQLEAGSVATSLIPTSGGNAAARTRAADDLVISGSAFTDFYNQSEGTVYVEYEPRIVSSTNCLFTFSDGTTSHRILSLVSESYSLFINNGSNLNYFSVNVDPQANNLNRLACTFKTNNASASLNGSTGDYDTSLTMPVNTRINLGTRQDGSQPLNGHIKRLIYWPYHSDSL